MTHERLALADELQTVAEQARDMERIAEAHLFRLIPLLEQGDTTGFRCEVQALQRLAHGLRHPILEWLGMALQTTLC